MKRKINTLNLIRIIIIVLIIVSIPLGSVLARIYTDWLWFNEVGYQSVFLKIILTKLLIGFGAGGIFFIFIFLNLLLAKSLAPKWRVISEDEIIESTRAFLTRFNLLIFLGVSFIIALIAGIFSIDKWDTVLRYFNQTSFNLSDPIFHRDVGFYIFSLPLYQSLYYFLMSLIVITTILTAVVHLIDGAINFRRGGQFFSLYVKAHLSILIGLGFILKAFGYYLNIYELVYSPRGVVFGASYTDFHALLPALKLLIFVAVLCAILFIINLYLRGLTLPIAGVIILIASSFLAGVVYPEIIQRYKVAPNEIVCEKKYIKYNIAYTRKAYNLDNIKESFFPTEGDLTLEEIKENEVTIKNIRLWDWRPLLKTYAQLQEIRLYYTFHDVDVDRYQINGEYRQVLLSARELSLQKLPQKAKTWINQHLVYTHGYGLCLSPVNEVTREGLPRFLIKDIPPISSINLKVIRPEIYFGEETNDYVVVKTKTKEFDYPLGDKNKYTLYQGKGGVLLSSFLRKALFAWRFGDLQLLLSNAITSESRIIFRRQISERLKLIAPFLYYDADPYLVLHQGRLFWILDAYTLTDMYPYSEPFDGKNNYIRNSVKVVVDAYNGETKFYVVDEKDPLIKTYRRIFPLLFRSFNQMPLGLKKHLRYPVDMFKIQANLYSSYHMKDPQVFYNKEDLWSIPNEIFENQEQPMEPYYIIMKFSGEKREKFLLMLPFTPSNRNNMIAWLSANCDWPDYGNLLVYKFFKQKLIYGPMQIEARINQDPEISKLLTLWGQRGSQVIRGNLLVIPIERSLLYVEPLYLQAEQSQLPELKRVTLAYGSRIVMEDDLDKAIEKVFGVAEKVKKPEEVKVEKEKIVDLVEAAYNHYQRGLNYLKGSDWAAYGEEMKKLGEILNILKEKVGKRQEK